MTILDQRTVTARKQHLCDCCSLHIEPGQKYLRVKGPGDYGWRTWRWCEVCEGLAEDLFKADVYSEDPETGADCWPYLPDLDLSEIPEGDLRVRFDAWRDRRQKGLAR